MKKLILLLFIPIISFGQLSAQTSGNEVIVNSIKDMNITLIKDPGLKDIEKNSNIGDSIHFIAHGEYENIIFKNNILNGDKICEILPNLLYSVSFSVCKSGKINNNEPYPFNHQSWAHKLMNKQTKKILTHVWDVGQNASLAFMPEYLINSKYSDKISAFIPSENGGYMCWGV